MAETEHINSRKFKEVHVGLVVLFSLLTLGVYLGYWFLSRRQTIREYAGSQFIPFKWWRVFIILLTLSFLYKFFGPIFLTPYGIAIFDSIDIIFSYYFLSILYYSVFRLRTILEEAYGEKLFAPWLLVLFHVWYIQFKINRLGDVDSNEKVFAPQMAK
ncbi:hypothetical protein [Robertmurraya sp. P23]|uniref:hypothetical protein n=1 Tax=Robertmurraya sp. P23 TaxID=3436931 RepID=UPI003D98A065